MAAGSPVLTSIALLILSGATILSPPAGQDRSVTVTGCVERDAAASTPIYKLIVPQTDAPPVIYQLNTLGNAAVPSAVGKTAQVTGPVTSERRAGREIRVLTVKAFEVVAERCSLPLSNGTPLLSN